MRLPLRWSLAVSGVVLAMVTTACAGAKPPQASPATTQTASVEKVLNAAAPNLNIFGPEKGCIERRLEDDPGLRNALASQAPGPETSSYKNLEKIKEACTNEVTFAASFAELERQDHDPLTTDQLDCLRAGFTKLSAEDVARITSEGLVLTDPEALARLKTLEISCDIRR